MTAKKAKRPAAPLGHVLSVASECGPLVKTGGLADVVGALPAALSGEGWSLRTLLPAYPGLVERLTETRVLWTDDDVLGKPARVVAGRIESRRTAPLWLLLDIPDFFDREGAIYTGPDGQDWPDNAMRYAALCWAAAKIARDGCDDGWRPDVVHAHDWQAGLAPTYIKQLGVDDVGSLLTIHNIAFQGTAPASILGALRLPGERYHAEGFEFWGRFSALKAGLVDADRITTVSPTYVRELATPEFGMGLDGVIRMRKDDMSGILNGVDLKVWNPRKDPMIEVGYGVSRLDDKRGNRDVLTAEFGLLPGEGPLFGVVSRLTWQKGMDLLMDTLPLMVERGCRLVVLGSGERELEERLLRAARDHPGIVGARIGYDEALAHRIFAGADSVVVPSRFEPCGLTQMYALRYGSPPLVAATGGLADTVIDANDAGIRAGVATGFEFLPVTAEALADSIRRVCDLFARPSVWRSMQERAMKHPVGWKESAKAYAALYESLTA